MVDVYANYSLVWVKKGADNKPATGDKITLSKSTGLAQFVGTASTVTTPGIGLKNGNNYETLIANVFTPADLMTVLKINLLNPAHTIKYSGTYNADKHDITTFAGTIETADPSAQVEVTATNKFGVVRTYTVNVEFTN